MAGDRPTLATAILRRHLWAGALTLGAAMLVLLALADLNALSAKRMSLARELRRVQSVDVAQPGSTGLYKSHVQGDTGYLLVDAQGAWADEDLPELPAHRPQPHHWAPTARVLAQGRLGGRGRLPWLDEPVVWAAQRMYDPDGGQMVLVAWHPIRAVRVAAVGTYAGIVAALVLAFGVNVVLALQTARRVSAVIESVAASSSRMAAGDFRVQLPPQPTAELDRLSTAISRLAADLDRATADLARGHERVRQLENLQRQFVADASHELRAPLTAMRVTLEAWQDGVLRPEEEPAAREQLLRETNRLAGLVSSLLDLSRLESGRETLACEPVSLAPLAAAVAEAYGDAAGPPLVVEMPAALPPVQADPKAVHRILCNLVTNAQRFTPADGRVVIRGRLEDPWIVLEVADSGRGIDPELLPRIWDRFARAGDQQAGEQGGSGLGLAIVRALAEAMHGEVAAESEAGCGTTVSVRLPRAGADLSER